MSDISALWERIETWYEAQGASHLLNPGASAQAIAEAEAALGLTFPAELKESLLRHDGSTWSGWAEGELLSLTRIAEERGVWMEVLESGTFDASNEYDDFFFDGADGAFLPSWWNVGWIPLDADGGSNGHFIDTTPGPNGREGQIGFMDHERGPQGPRFASLEEYLQSVADELESGAYIYSSDYGDTGGIVSRPASGGQR